MVVMSVCVVFVFQDGADQAEKAISEKVQEEKAEETADEIKSEIKNVVHLASNERERQSFIVTAYTAGVESTGKRPGDPGYGVTASGERVKEGRTIACPKRFPFGTEIYISHFDNTFICEDRGGAIKGDRLDIYMEDLGDALDFGRRELEVEIIKGDE